MSFQDRLEHAKRLLEEILERVERIERTDSERGRAAKFANSRPKDFSDE